MLKQLELVSLHFLINYKYHNSIFILFIKRFHFYFFSHYIQENTDTNIDNLASRFRGNLIIDGSKPFDEDEWKTVLIGHHSFKVNSIKQMFLMSNFRKLQFRGI